MAGGSILLERALRRAGVLQGFPGRRRQDQVGPSEAWLDDVSQVRGLVSMGLRRLGLVVLVRGEDLHACLQEAHNPPDVLAGHVAAGAVDPAALGTLHNPLVAVFLSHPPPLGTGDLALRPCAEKTRRRI